MEVKLKKVLERECKSAGKSVNLIAEETGVPSSTLHSWLQGQLPSAKNLHHLKSLCDYFHLSLEHLLFNTSKANGSATILFSSEFKDQDMRYRLTVERIKE